MEGVDRPALVKGSLKIVYMKVIVVSICVELGLEEGSLMGRIVPYFAPPPVERMEGSEENASEQISAEEAREMVSQIRVREFSVSRLICFPTSGDL